ncbi:glycosyltransferase [Luteimonas pelagia]
MYPEILFHELLFQVRRARATFHRFAGSVHARGWRATIARARHGTPLPGHAAARGTPRHDPRRPLLVVVESELPREDRDSGSVRLVHLLRLLVADGWQVVMVADAGGDADAERILAGIGVGVVSHAPRRWLARHARDIRAAIVARHGVAGHWLPYLRAIAPGARLVFDTVDLHHVREGREAALNGLGGLGRHARRTQQRELALVRMADATWVVSDHEREALRAACPGARVGILSNIVARTTPGRPYDEREGIVFVGGHRHPPNTDACRWLVRELFPRVREALPGVELHLIGAGMPADLAAAARGVAGIRVHGHVPDVTPWLEGCRVALVPLRFGAGVKGKVNASMAHGQPVVTTPCGAEGMGLADGHDVLVASDADGLVDAVVRVYRDRALWDSISRNALQAVAGRFSAESARDVARRDLGRPEA